jgi:GNAT superfamily N-acetyltransferase
LTLWVERLGRQHQRRAFRSGRAELDDWFHRSAGQADRRQNSARVWVLCDSEVEDGRQPLGFYALVAHAVTVAATPAELSRGLPPGYPIGAVLLARLALDEGRHGEGLGTRLLADAVRRIAAADEHVAVPLLVVDAIDEAAAAFYERHGFQGMPSDRLRLAARLVDIRRTFTELDPMMDGRPR